MSNENPENAPEEISDKHAVQSVSDQEAMIDLVRAVNGLRKVVFLMAIGLIGVSVLAAIGFFRRPKVLVAVQTADGRRITQIDDTNFGAVEPVQMGEDNLTNEDKKELVNNFLQSFYAVDLASRSKDVPKALRMMVKQTADQYYKNLTETGYLQRERDEGYSATWATESFEIDRSDKNIAHVIGTQLLRRNIGGKLKKERVQYKITFDLFTDGKRDSSPLRTGYWIANVKAEEISRNEEA